MAYKTRESSTDISVLNDVNKIPDTCAACGKGIEPVFCYQYGVDTWREYEGFLQIVFRCPIEKCQRLFIALYGAERGYRETNLIFRRTFLLDSVEFEEFTELIKEVSEKFPRIYNQAKIAEDNGLDEIAGVGYGKALEFLIKDYLVHRNPEKEAKIKKMYLSDAIKEIEAKDLNIKKCAERANWLRTDETHYERRWGEHDLNDLKNLIKLTINWIESSLMTEQYEKDMQLKKQ